MERPTRRFTLGASLLAALALATLASSAMAALAAIPTDFPDPAGRKLPQPLQRRLTDLGKRPHTYRPLTIFSEAPTPSRLFGYYLLDGGGFQPNVFTAVIPDLNSGVVPTATGANGDLPPIGSVRLALEPKPGLSIDPNDVESFIDVFTDISGLFVINNESGWY